MIKKIYRLKEKEVKKVLHKWKPFFSYGIVLNRFKNKLSYSRFAIVIWAKSVKTNVERNFFRRKFYDIVSKKVFSEEKYDFVFVIKKNNKLDKKNPKSIIDFENDLEFLMKKAVNSL